MFSSLAEFVTLSVQIRVCVVPGVDPPLCCTYRRTYCSLSWASADRQAAACWSSGRPLGFLGNSMTLQTAGIQGSHPLFLFSPGAKWVVRYSWGHPENECPEFQCTSTVWIACSQTERAPERLRCSRQGAAVCNDDSSQPDIAQPVDSVSRSEYWAVIKAGRRAAALLSAHIIEQMAWYSGNGPVLLTTSHAWLASGISVWWLGGCVVQSRVNINNIGKWRERRGRAWMFTERQTHTNNNNRAWGCKRCSLTTPEHLRWRAASSVFSTCRNRRWDYSSKFYLWRQRVSICDVTWSCELLKRLASLL